MPNKPIQLKVSLFLLYTVAFITSIRGFFSVRDKISTLTPGNYIHFWFFLIFIIFLMFYILKKIGDGSYWARNLYIVFLVLGLVKLPSVFSGATISMELTLTLLLTSMQIAGVIMLFHKENKIWFALRNKELS